jgi:hypothetical protein
LPVRERVTERERSIARTTAQLTNELYKKGAPRTHLLAFGSLARKDARALSQKPSIFLLTLSLLRDMSANGA